MKRFNAIVATLILAGILSVASAANQYVEASSKLDDIMSNALGLAVFVPNIVMTDKQLHITLSPTQMGDYPTQADVRAIIELYYKIVAGTGYAGSLTIIINNLDGIGKYRWDVRPDSKADFDDDPDYVILAMRMLNPGQEGIAGSAAWLYSDPNYVDRPRQNWTQV